MDICTYPTRIYEMSQNGVQINRMLKAYDDLGARNFHIDKLIANGEYNSLTIYTIDSFECLKYIYYKGCYTGTGVS